jgi:hypothetical protein
MSLSKVCQDSIVSKRKLLETVTIYDLFSDIECQFRGPPVNVDKAHAIKKSM